MMNTKQFRFFKFNEGEEITLQQVKRMYHKLARVHHPDIGGKKEDMQQLNNEYESIIKYLKAGGKIKNDEEFKSAENFKEVIDKLINLPGLTIEIVGSWVWVSGNTYTYKNILRDLGFTWCKRHKKWALIQKTQ